MTCGLTCSGNVKPLLVRSGTGFSLNPRSGSGLFVDASQLDGNLVLLPCPSWSSSGCREEFSEATGRGPHACKYDLRVERSERAQIGKALTL